MCHLVAIPKRTYRFSYINCLCDVLILWWSNLKSRSDGCGKNGKVKKKKCIFLSTKNSSGCRRFYQTVTTRLHWLVNSRIITFKWGIFDFSECRENVSKLRSSLSPFFFPLFLSFFHILYHFHHRIEFPKQKYLSVLDLIVIIFLSLCIVLWRKTWGIEKKSQTKILLYNKILTEVPFVNPVIRLRSIISFCGAFQRGISLFSCKSVG